MDIPSYFINVSSTFVSPSHQRIETLHIYECPFFQSSRSNSAVHWKKPQDNRTFSVERECHLQMTKILVICEKIALIAIGSTRRVGHVTYKESDWKSQLTIGRQQ